MMRTLRTLLVTAYLILLLKYWRTSSSSRPKDAIVLNYVIRPPGSLIKIMRQLRKNARNLSNFQSIPYSRPTTRLPTDLKYILKWTDTLLHESIFSKIGQRAFIDSNCTHYNCYLSSDKSLLIDPSYFDAILFDVQHNNWDPHPILRSPSQKYIMMGSEASHRHPICDPYYDDYYNLTWTYKLDSDIRWSYITILDKQGNFVGPKKDMTWIQPMKAVSQTVVRRLVHKRKAVAWFSSNCRSKSGREKVARDLMKELDRYNLNIDVYGWCGKKHCPKERSKECWDIIEQNYYFYLSFENSLSEDYVTEKLLHPLRHYTVPVVYGGANYSRFLPPGSYINAKESNASTVALLINRAIQNPKLYQDYFRWHNYYKYRHTPLSAEICELCRIMNDPTKSYSVFRNLRYWWNPNFEEQCTKQLTTEKYF